MAVVFNYDGATTLIAQFDSVVGHDYQLMLDTSSANGAFETATTTTTTLTAAGADFGTATAGRRYFIYLADMTTGLFLACALIQSGTAQEYLSPTGSFTYDGANATSVTFTAPAGHAGHTFTLETIDPNFNGLGLASASGTGSSQTLSKTIGAGFGMDGVLLSLRDTDGRDWAVTFGARGSASLGGGSYTFGTIGAGGGGGGNGLYATRIY